MPEHIGARLTLVVDLHRRLSQNSRASLDNSGIENTHHKPRSQNGRRTELPFMTLLKPLRRSSVFGRQWCCEEESDAFVGVGVHEWLPPPQIGRVRCQCEDEVVFRLCTSRRAAFQG